jgi:hypothetical protein
MHSLTTLLQLVAAFVIFAAAYLALLLSVVICFAIAICVRKVGRLTWAYTVKSASLDRNLIPRIDSQADCQGVSIPVPPSKSLYLGRTFLRAMKRVLLPSQCRLRPMPRRLSKEA